MTRRVWLWVLHHADKVAFVGTFVVILAAALASDSINAGGRGVLYAAAALNVGILGVVLTALTVMTVFLGDEFLVILERIDKGVAGAFRPYIIVAVVSGLGALVALLGAFGYPAAGEQARAGFLALGLAMLAAAVVGMVQLVELTAFLGKERSHLLAGMRHAETERQRRLRETA